MALTITAANVLPATGYQHVGSYVAGENLTPFVPVYVNSSDGKVYKCDANDNTKLVMVGVTMNTATLGQKVVVGAGKIDVGAILTKGLYYVVSATAGLVMETADLVEDDYIVQVGFAMTTSIMNVIPVNWGVQTPAAP